MRLDFFSNISLPVYLDLELTSYNEETGEIIINNNNNMDIINEPTQYIDNAQDLINILPNRITASGKADVGSLSI